MKTQKITKIWIENVQGIQVIKPQKRDEKEGGYPDAYGLAECRLIIDCGNDEASYEVIELILNASYAEKLEFKEAEDDWIMPKVYKGKSMSEEE